MKVKEKAIKLVVEDLIKNSNLWTIYGDKWKEPRYYSLIMQPFIISPAINVGDIMCSVAINGPSCDYDLEACMRLQHPFPILERYAEADITFKNEVVVQKGTHVIIFTSDFADSKINWPLFGSGPRACSGSHLALPVLKVLMTDLVKHPLFNPLKNHRYSGRHLDGKASSSSEYVYFVATVLNAFHNAMMSSGSTENTTGSGSKNDGDDGNRNDDDNTQGDSDTASGDVSGKNGENDNAGDKTDGNDHSGKNDDGDGKKVNEAETEDV
jgi:hypothetical protein